MLKNAFKRIITKPHRLNYLWTLLTSPLLLPGRPTSSSHRLSIVESYATIHNDDAESEIKDKSDQSHISEPAERAQRRVHELLPPGDEQPSDSCDPGCLD